MSRAIYEALMGDDEDAMSPPGSSQSPLGSGTSASRPGESISPLDSKSPSPPSQQQGRRETPAPSRATPSDECEAAAAAGNKVAETLEAKGPACAEDAATVTRISQVVSELGRGGSWDPQQRSPTLTHSLIGGDRDPYQLEENIAETKATMAKLQEEHPEVAHARTQLTSETLSL